jgi:hypothetical protein
MNSFRIWSPSSGCLSGPFLDVQLSDHIYCANTVPYHTANFKGHKPDSTQRHRQHTPQQHWLNTCEPGTTRKTRPRWLVPREIYQVLPQFGSNLLFSLRSKKGGHDSSKKRPVCLWPEQSSTDTHSIPQLRQMWGTSPYPHRCSQQAATTNFTPVPAPTCFNLLPSTLNFIFLMKCHLLTSGRIIIKRNGHKAILCRKQPCQLAPPPSWRGSSTVILCSQLLEYPKPVLRSKMAQTAPFQVSGPSSMSSRKGRQAAAPAAATQQATWSLGPPRRSRPAAGHQGGPSAMVLLQMKGTKWLAN